MGKAVEATVAAETILDHRNLDVLILGIATQAQKFWEKDPADFKILYVGVTGILFGETNQVKWNISDGFQPVKAHCTEAFLAHFDALQE